MKQRVRVLKDLPEMKLVGRQVGPLTVGQETEFEPWEVRVLERSGVIEPVQKITTGELRKYILAEERAPGLVQLPPNFYAIISQRAAIISKTDLQEEIEEFKSAFEALAEVRTQKLLRAALSPSNAENLLPDERFVVNRLAMDLEDWGKWLGEIFGREAEIEDTA